MGLLTGSESGWAYVWRNCGIGGAESYLACFTNARVRTNIMYNYEDLCGVVNDPAFKSQLPRAILEKALGDYPLNKKKKGRVAA